MQENVFRGRNNKENRFSLGIHSSILISNYQKMNGGLPLEGEEKAWCWGSVTSKWSFVVLLGRALWILHHRKTSHNPLNRVENIHNKIIHISVWHIFKNPGWIY